jgi:hypothetical protein
MREGFIGLGTGRCGTKSIAALIQNCKNTKVTHEQYISQWYANDDILKELVEDIKKYGEEGVLRGEVQCQLLSHVPWLRMHLPDLKIVAIHRDKTATVKSHMNNLRPMFRPFDKIKNYGPDSIWPGRYPLIDAANAEQAYEFWWEFYERLSRDIVGPVLHLDIEEVNDSAGVVKLFDFLEIPEEDRVFTEVRNWGEDAWLKLIDSDAPRVLGD